MEEGVQKANIQADTSCCCLVPLDSVGLIVGRGGTTIRQISRESGADISISSEDNTPQALSDRIVTIRGQPAEKERACRRLVEIIYRFQDVEDGELGIFVLLVPASSVGYIIGPNCSTLSNIVEASGARADISDTSIADTELRPVTLSGTLAQTLSAAGRFDALLQQLADRGCLDGDLWQPSRRQLARQAISGMSGGGRDVDRGNGGGREDTFVGGPVTGCSSGGGGSSGAASTGVAVSSSAGSRSSTPVGRRKAEVTDAAAMAMISTSVDRFATVVVNGKGSSAGGRNANSRSLTPNSRRSGGSGRFASEPAIRFVVSEPVAAWIVGKGGRSVAELRAKSCADIEVARDGGATRIVEIRGPRDARKKAIELFLQAVETFPPNTHGAPTQAGEAKLLVPVVVVDVIAAAVSEIREASGADVELVSLNSLGDSLLVISGGNGANALAAATRAAQHAATLLVQSNVTSVTASPAVSTRAALSSAAVSVVSEMATSVLEAEVLPRCSRASSASRSRLAASGDAAGVDCRSAGIARRASSASPSRPSAPLHEPPMINERPQGLSGGLQAPLSGEAALLKALLAGTGTKAQLRLVLPCSFVEAIVSQGLLRDVAGRSGSKFEFSAPLPVATSAAQANHASDTAELQLVTITGTMVGNSMAVYYLQELLVRDS
eukprot:TRINITY_DN29634_c0_g1_i1.p1 TRINITY_DN29634_c0_g1~~TRINITY_DN29634_c0_g1_i1.p1  ORF type:complete len:667 (+),score=133.02 TRINITY_DN29634_c0_g1_i1:231-2231(+)